MNVKILLSKIGISTCTNPVEYSMDSGFKLRETFSIEVNFHIILASHRKLHVALAEIRFKFSPNFQKKTYWIPALPCCSSERLVWHI